MNKLRELLKKKEVQLVLALLLGITIGAVFYPTKNIEERMKTEITEKYELQIQEMKREHSSSVSALQQTLDEQERQSREYREETSIKISSLTTENRELRQSMKKKKFKLVKPDGTVIEKEYEESQSEEISSVVTEVRQEFDRKVASIEEKWKTVHQRRVETLKKEYEVEIEKVRKEQKEKIVYVEKEKIVEVNKKKFRPELGVTSDKELYLHGSYPVWGPLFIGGGFTGGVGLDGSESSFDHASIGIGIEF